jgi:S-adenosylmethionine decarboxylase proenzyme
MNPDEITLGRQLTATYEGCQLQPLGSASLLLGILRAGLRAGGFNEVSVHMHEFAPHGVTCVVILEESHLVAHSWPEHSVLLIDLFACSSTASPEAALEHVEEALGCIGVTIEDATRSISPPAKINRDTSALPS